MKIFIYSHCSMQNTQAVHLAYNVHDIKINNTLQMCVILYV